MVAAKGLQFGECTRRDIVAQRKEGAAIDKKMEVGGVGSDACRLGMDRVHCSCLEQQRHEEDLGGLHGVPGSSIGWNSRTQYTN